MVGLASFFRRLSFLPKRRPSWCGLLVWHMSYVATLEGCLASLGKTIPALGSDVLPCKPLQSWPKSDMALAKNRFPVLHTYTKALVRPNVPRSFGAPRLGGARGETRSLLRDPRSTYAVVVHGALLELSDAECLEGIEVSWPLNLARVMHSERLSLASRPGRAVTTSSRNATWLILPVVICLSQRLSHACVSMN